MDDFSRAVADLEARIGTASPAGRVALQPELADLLRRMQEAGVPVPARLRNLDAELTDEAIEDRFDNVPV